MKELTTEEKLIGEIAEQNNPYDKQLSSRHLFTEGFKAGYRYAINVCDFADAVFNNPKQYTETTSLRAENERLKAIAEKQELLIDHYWNNINWDNWSPRKGEVTKEIKVELTKLKEQ